MAKVLLFLMFVRTAFSFDLTCVEDNVDLPVFSYLMENSTNATFLDTEVCKTMCQRNQMGSAGIEGAMYCFCSVETEPVLPASISCDTDCLDGTQCGGSLAGILTLFKLVPASRSINLTFVMDLDIIKVAETVTAIVNASEGTFIIDWGDGGTPVDDGLTHVYNLPGVYLITALIKEAPEVSSSVYVTVHDKPVIEVLCPHVVQLGVSSGCQVVYNRQGFDYQLSWNLTNGTSTEATVANFPAAILHTIGNTDEGATPSPSTLPLGDLVIVPNQDLNNGGYLTRVKISASTSGVLGIYLLTPTCLSGTYCGDFEMCSASCTSRIDPLVCSNALCPTRTTCNSNFCTNPTNSETTLDYTLLTSVDDTETDLLVSFWIPAGSILAFGCASNADCLSTPVVLSTRPIVLPENPDTIFSTGSAISTSATEKYLVQLIIREDLPLNASVDITCQSLAPIPVSEVLPVPHDATSVSYVNQSKLEFKYEISSASAADAASFTTFILCQQVILDPILKLDVWMAFGSTYDHLITFTQGSPLFSEVDIDGIMFYNYHDEVLTTYEMNVLLSYVQEGEYVMVGNTSNIISTVSYETIVHVVPVVTDNWILNIVCPCFDVEIGFPFELTLASAPNPPWNVSFNSPFFELGTLFPQEMIDFETFGNMGAAVQLAINRQAIVLTKGIYTVNVFLENEVSNTTITETFEVVEGIRDVFAHMYWNNSGIIMEGLGPDKTIFMANQSTFIYPVCRTGIPDYWRLRINETGEEWTSSDTFGNFTLMFPQEEEVLTVIIGGFNTIQGWVESPPIKLKVVFKIQGMYLTDTGVISKPNEVRNMFCDFMVFTPLACVMIDYGEDPPQSETFGNEDVCKGKYADVPFMGSFPSPIPIPHTYTAEKVYTVKAIAFDDQEVLTHSLSVPVGDIPCTMPIVSIVDGMRIVTSGTEYLKSIQVILESASEFQCNGTFVVEKWWTITYVDSETGSSLSDINIFEILKSWKFSQLTIPPSFLNYGMHKITYSLKIIISPTLYLERSDYTFVRIIPSPIIAIMVTGSSSRTKLGFGQMIDLDAVGLSSDPDYPEDRNLNITWWCRQLVPNLEPPIPLEQGRLSVFNEHEIPLSQVAFKSGWANEGCFGNGSATIRAPGRIQFDTSSFLYPEGTFEFTIEVTKNDRVAWSSLILEIVPHPPPTMLIDCNPSICFPTNDGLVVNPTKRLALPGSCINYCSDITKMKYKWTIKSDSGAQINMSTLNCPGVTSGSDGAVVSLESSDCVTTFITDMESSDFAMNSIFFDNNINIDKFIMRLTGITDNGAEGYSEISIVRNKPPTGGSCDLQEMIGDALISVYPIVCQQWFDPDKVGISSYTYYYYLNTTDGLKKQTIATTSKSSLELIMPVGNFEIFVDISDRLNAITTYPLGKIEVGLPTEMAVDSYNPSSVMAYLEATGDSTTLGMVLAAVSSVKDNAEWLSLDPEITANLTEEELLLRIADISKINADTLETTLNTMDFSTVDQLNVGSGILQSTLAGVFGSKLGPMTVGIDTRSSAMELLEKLSTQVAEVNIDDPNDLTPFLSNQMDAASAIMKSINAVISNDEPLPVSLTDLETAANLDYETYIPGVGFTSTTNQKDQLTDNVIFTTKQQSEKQIESIFNIVDKMAATVYDKLVSGEVVKTNSPNGASMMIAKLNEKLLEDGLAIEGTGNSAKISFPKMFCPSRYNTPNTICREEFRLTASVWPCITHLYPDSSKLLSDDTKIIDINVDIRSERVSVKNETNPIILRIPRLASDIPAPLYVNATIYEFGSLPIIYHWFNVSNTDSAYTIEITPNGILPSNMILLIDHERMPTPLKHLKRILVSDMNLDPNGTFTYFTSSKENENRTGRFFVGIGMLKSDVSLSATTKLTTAKFETDKFSIDYSFRVYLSGCYFFDKELSTWTGRNMYVIEASPSAVTCATSHMTAFGSGFLPIPNIVDFDFVFANYGLVDNISIYCVLILVISLFVIMIIWGHYMDRKDLIKQGVLPLPDNKSEDKYLYEITFKTGSDSEASCDSNIRFIASGDFGETIVRVLPSANNFLYRRFASNKFVMAVPKPLGHINYLRIFHDNTGEPPLDSWQVEMTIFRDLQTNEKSIFDTNSWLALDRDNGMVDKTFMSLEGDSEKSFSQEMYIRGNKSMNQDHMWLSIFMRPPESRYGRKERVAVCASFLFLTLLVNALWYETSTDTPRDGYINFGLLSISLDLLIASAIVVVVVYPFTYILIFIFKRARPKNLKRCRALTSIEEQRKSQLVDAGIVDETELQKNSRVELDEQKSPKQKEKSPVKCIPWWTRILAWIMILSIICGCTFIVWSFGIMWGEIKTVKFLSSFIFSFLISIIATQWIKVLVNALCSSLCTKINLTIDDADCDEELPALKKNEEWTHMRYMDPGKRKTVHRVEGVDPDNSKVTALRERMMKDREMGQVVKSIFIYCLFLTVIYILVDGRMDYNAFLMQDHLKASFIKEKHPILDYSRVIKTSSDWWMWAKTVIMPEIRAQRSYNNDPPYGLKGFLNDRASRMIGYAIIRQIRSMRHNCIAPVPLDELIDHCSGVRGILNEESKDFCAQWNFNESFTGACNWEEYKYLTASELQTYTTTGRLGMYSGGGYVLRLSGPQSHILRRMTQLQENHWIDQNTRAVILEFSVYNANVNLFSICTVMAEFLDGGGMIPKWRFEPIRLIKADGLDGIVTTVAEFLYCFAIIFFTINELWSMKKLKCQYFDSYWNISEICILLISYATISLYIYRSVLTDEALKVFNVTAGNGYVRMDSAAVVDQFFLYTMGMVVFFSTLKLIKLLQFNKRMNVLARTITICWDELKVFLVAFAIIFFAFACLFFFMFNSDLEDFSEILRALQTSFKMMLGKFDFEAMQRANAISPLLFFVFSVMNSMILINIMLTIILQAFNIVKHDIAKQDNRLNVVDYVFSQFKQFIRNENRPRIHVQMKLTDKKDCNEGQSTDESKSDQLPDKVGQLVKYINTVYFDGRLDMTDSQAKKSMINSSSGLKFSLGNNDQERKILNSDS